jgi:FMN phosphatase YigB (HAD superfamily)
MALPMPEPTRPPLPLTQYKVLSFDVYGSLVEYKSHILNAFQPLLSRLAPTSPYLDSTPLSTAIPDSATRGSIEFLKVFQRQEDAIKLEKPAEGKPADSKRFDKILAEIWRRVAQELTVDTSEEEALGFGSEAVISGWPLFPGTLDALKALSKHYRLVALSNIDRYAWSITSSPASTGLGEVEWWKVFTAEDYDDDEANDAKRADESKLETLIEFCRTSRPTQGGVEKVEKHEILHVAQSLGHDQAPAKRLGLSSVWLIGDGPRWGKEAESKMALEKKLVGYAWRYNTLKEFADEVEKAFNDYEG